MLCTPALACLDRSDLSIAEQECCKQMAEHCDKGMANMPSSHSCCTPEASASNSQTAFLRTVLLDLSQVSLTAVLATVPVMQGSGINAEMFHIPETTAESPPTSIAILRI
jgi:hypothetical protein